MPGALMPTKLAARATIAQRLCVEAEVGEPVLVPVGVVVAAGPAHVHGQLRALRSQRRDEDCVAGPEGVRRAGVDPDREAEKGGAPATGGADHAVASELGGVVEGARSRLPGRGPERRRLPAHGAEATAAL